LELRNHADSHRRKWCCNCSAWAGSVVRLAIVFFKGGGFESRVAVALFSEISDLSIKFALQAWFQWFEVIHPIHRACRAWIDSWQPTMSSDDLAPRQDSLKIVSVRMKESNGTHLLIELKTVSRQCLSRQSRNRLVLFETVLLLFKTIACRANARSRRSCLFTLGMSHVLWEC